MLYEQKKVDEANEMYQRVLDGRKAMDTLSGKMSTETLSTTNIFANLLLSQGMLDLARDMYERSLKGYEKQYGTHHPETLKGKFHRIEPCLLL